MRRIKYYKSGKGHTLPIKDKKMLTRVFDYLIMEKEHAKSESAIYRTYRNYMLFLIGFNTAFRAEDLLQLRVKDVIKGYVSIKENKTGKMQNFRMNKDLHTEILKYIDKFKLKDTDYLFMGQTKKMTYKGVTKRVIYPITRQNCDKNIFPKICEACGIDFKFSLHSLRKTFGYQYILNGGNIVTLQKMYNHENPTITMMYVMWDTNDAESAREASFVGKKT